jgi:multicomponent Na+:H+ antiporter subunit E
MILSKEGRSRNGAFRAAIYVILWWILTDGNPTSWLMGGLSVGFAVFVGTLLFDQTAWSWSFKGLIRFVPFFLVGSVRAGMDVMRRAIHPKLPINPALIHYRLRLPVKPARIFMACTLTLMPGTLSAGLSETHVTVHLLDANLFSQGQLEKVELRVADLFGLELRAVIEEEDRS